MPGPQWIGSPPPNLKYHHILVLGPDDFEDKKLVWKTLSDYTLRLEAVRILVATYSLPKGVSKLAEQWAEREWWPRCLSMTRWFGSVKKRDEDILNCLRCEHTNKKPSRHCITFYQEDMDQDTLNLMEQAREIVRMKNFHIIEV